MCYIWITSVTSLTSSTVYPRHLNYNDEVTIATSSQLTVKMEGYVK